jgi:AraC-like DNA-binding protein
MHSLPRHGRGSARTLPAHRDEGLEIIYLEKGALNWHVEGRVERVTAGSVYFSLPWESHGSADEYEPGHFWHWVHFRLEGRTDQPRRRFGFHRDFGLSAAEGRELSERLVAQPRRTVPATARMAWLLPALVEELARPASEHSQGYLTALARLVLLEMRRCLDSTPAPARAGASRARVERFVAGLATRCAEPWTVEAMAAECGLARARFAVLCEELSGDSPVNLVNRLRIEQAKRALRDTAAAVTEIAFAGGFSSSQYFARVFRRFTGLDARTYRARHRRHRPERP